MPRVIPLPRSVLWIGCALVSLGTTEGLGAEAEGADRPAPLARYFPRQDLGVLVEFDGLDAHAERWRKSAAYRLLNETGTGAMLKDLAAQLAGRALATSGEKVMTGPDLVTVVEHAFRAGFAFGINRPPGEPRPSSVALVIRGAGQGKARAILGRLIDAEDGKSEAVALPGGRRINVVGGLKDPSFAWWREGDDLVINGLAMKGAGLMAEALDGARPSAVEHPARVELARIETGKERDEDFVPVGLAFFDMDALPALPPKAAAFGLDRLKRIDYRWGFQGKALRSVTRLVAPAPRGGALALLDQPVLKVANLPSLPKGLASFTAASADLRPLYDGLKTLARATSPEMRMAFDSLERDVRRVTGRDLRDEVLVNLGPTWAFYEVPTRTTLPTGPVAGLTRGLTEVPRACLLIEVRDPQGFGPILNDLRAGIARDAPKGKGGIEVKPWKGREPGFILSIAPGIAPLPAGMRPTVVLGSKFLAIATTPETARLALGREGRAGGLEAGDSLAPWFDRLPEGPSALILGDTSASLLPEVIANLPRLVQIAGARNLLGLFGLPGAPRRIDDPRLFPFRAGNGFQVKIDPDEVPLPDELRPYLFPATFTFSADGQGFTFDSRESFPGLNPTTLVPIALALLLPAAHAAQTAARRSQSVGNLKQIGLALHNYHSTNNHFPPGAIRDKNGKPLLSWRVELLPYLEQAALYQEFQLDEPWDSPHNKPLMERMPAVYAVPRSRSGPGETFYRGFSGPMTLFDPEAKNGVGIADVTDGTSNTLGVVEAREAVPWTKPDAEIPFEGPGLKPEVLAKLPPRLGGHFPGGFNALFLDGSVRFLKDSINIQVLHTFITRNGGEVISGDSF